MQHEGSVPHMAPWRAMVFYLVFGLLWFGVADTLLPHWTAGKINPTALHRWSIYLFVLITGLLAAWQMHRMMRAEAQRAATMQEFFHIVRHAPAGIARVDPVSGHVLWANGRLCRMLGLSLSELVLRDFRVLAPSNDPQDAQGQVERLLSNELDHFQDQRSLRHASTGQVFTVLCTVAVVRDQHGQPVLVYVLQDVSEIEAARRALAFNAHQLRLALDGSGSGMWDWDMERRCYTFSDGVAAMVRYTGDDLGRDLRFKHVVHPEDRELVHRAVERSMQTGVLFEVTARVHCFDGVYRWFQARGTRHLDAQGRVVRFSGIITDQTAQRLEQDRLRLAASVVDNTMEGVVVTDARSRILSVNAAFTRLLGYTEQEMLGKTPRMFKSGRHGPNFYAEMWASLEQTGHWRGEIWNRRKNGEVFPERMSLSSVRDGQGAVTHYVCMFTDISEEKAQQQRLEFLAHRDPLTGLSNRTWFGQEMERTVQQARDSGETMAVLLLNLDRFKDVNDSYGHMVGDEVLKHIARQVQTALRPGDMIGRMAGDEIIVVARHLQSRADAQEIADRLIRAAAQPWHSPDGFAVVVSVSAGICMFPEHASTTAALLQGAHAAVYGAKSGRGESSAWCFFDEDMTASARERIALEAKLRLAVDQEQLELYYQPQVDIASGRIVGAEALLRWNDPQEGFISPVRFIPVAESTGLIGPLGEWVIHEACRQAQRWRNQGLPAITVAVNVSPHQFLLTDIASCTALALERSGYAAEGLELEITESALAERPDEALVVLRHLRELGVRLAIDDFGTGYSSLAHLKRFPIDVLKIDQGFIRDIPHSSDDMAISRAIIAMGRSLELKVLAEGVETAAQLEFLRRNGCDYYQGYLCSKPVPAAEFAQLLSRNADTVS
ncbi:MAG: EAL domain-containing protein [Acidovorax sp.]|nr:EAL domain-containing protein [Acidovorax sp.]